MFFLVSQAENDFLLNPVLKTVLKKTLLLSEEYSIHFQFLYLYNDDWGQWFRLFEYLLTLCGVAQGTSEVVSYWCICEIIGILTKTYVSCLYSSYRVGMRYMKAIIMYYFGINSSCHADHDLLGRRERNGDCGRPPYWMAVSDVGLKTEPSEIATESGEAPLRHNLHYVPSDPTSHLKLTCQSTCLPSSHLELFCPWLLRPRAGNESY